MKVTVTGGAGFIGGNLCRTLLQRGHEVVALDDLSSGFRRNVPDGVQFRQGSILDATEVNETIAGSEAIVHLAARPSVPLSIVDPQLTNSINVSGTLNVLWAAKKADIQTVVVASSSSVYGANPAIPKSEDLRCIPMSPYAVSKLATESYCEAFRHCYDMNTIAFRFFNVFGPLQAVGHAYAAVVPAFIDSALRGRPLTVYGDGKQSRDFTYVDTVCEVLSRSIEENITPPSPVNLALGNRISLLELIGELEAITNSTLKVDHVEPRSGDVRHSQADARLLRDLFPDTAAPDFKVSLSETWEWYRDHMDTR